MTAFICRPGSGLRRVFIFLLVPIAFILITGGTACGKPKENRKTSGWIFSASTWLSTGQTGFTHTAGNPLAGDPTSELVYDGIDSYTVELAAEYRLRRWFVRGLVGYGAVSSGALTDDDYVSALGADFFLTTAPGEQRISSTRAEMEGDDLLYGTFDAGGYFFYNRRLKLRGYLGYLFLTEKLQAGGHAQIECTSIFFCAPAGTLPTTTGITISNTAEWNAMKMGLGVSLHVWRNLKLDLDAAFIPLAFLNSEDIHHLRTDLSQSPSALSEGQGLGYTFEAMAVYNVWSSLFIKAGYRYWDLRVDNGVDKIFAANGMTAKSVLNEFHTYRHGAVLGVEFRY